MNNNGLKIKNINSERENFTFEGKSIEEAIGNKIKGASFVLAFLNNDVVIGKFNNGKFSLKENQSIEEKQLKKLRVFNENEELFIWKSGTKLTGRYRKDTEGNGCKAIDAHQVLFGSETDGNIIKEERGTEIELPFDVPEMLLKNPGDRVKVHTRNYLGLNEAGQYTYIDSRLIGFTFGKNNTELGGK